MAPFIFGERNKIHIINLEKSLPMARDAYAFVKSIVADGGSVLFVGTKRSARDAIRAQADRCEMPFVSHRWLGGMLTNYKTVRQSVKRLKELEQMAEEGAFEALTKKEVLGLRREQDKLDRSLGGIKNMSGLPDALFIVDVDHEDIAVREARKLGIPVVAVVDTNCSPDGIDYVIPGNDDAMKAIGLYATLLADAVLDGKASLPEIALGEDEFVELDADGKPRRASGRKKKASRKPLKKATVRKKADVTRAAAAKAADEAPPADAPVAEDKAAKVEVEAAGTDSGKVTQAEDAAETVGKAEDVTPAVEKAEEAPAQEASDAGDQPDATEDKSDAKPAAKKKAKKAAEKPDDGPAAKKKAEPAATPGDQPAAKKKAEPAATPDDQPAAKKIAEPVAPADDQPAAKKKAAKKPAAKKSAAKKAATKKASSKKTATKKTAKKTAAKATAKDEKSK
jgi:small subunit ribosomal protein S2